MDTLNPEILRDIDGLAQVLASGSILLVTVEAEPRLSSEGFEDLSLEERDARLLQYFRDEFGSLVLGGISARDLTKNDIPILLSKILRAQISSSLVSRSKLKFHQLFNFLYADGCQMLTLGGIVDEPGAEDRLKVSGILKAKYIRRGEHPKTISVPPLTIREKSCIDNRLLLRGKKIRKALGLDVTLLNNYIEFYKYYPTYYETSV